MKKLSILSGLFLIPFLILSQTIIPGGNVSGTWTKENSPYEIYGDILVDYNDSLIINPGVEVIFQDSYSLTFFDYFNAIGEENDSIQFTVSDTTGYYNGTNISFKIKNVDWDEKAKSKYYVIEMKYCNIEFGGIEIFYDLNFENSSLKYGDGVHLGGFTNIDYYFTNFIISYNSSGISLYGANSNLYCTNGIISNNKNGWGIDEDFQWILHITNCVIEKNFGGIQFSETLQMDNVIIQDNIGGGGIYNNDGPFTGLSISNSTIRNNIKSESVFGNVNGGGLFVQLDSWSSMSIINTIISNNSAINGGGIYITGYGYEDTFTEFDNVIISGNHAYNKGGGIFFYNFGDSDLTIDNTTIVGNSADNLGGGIIVENMLPIPPITFIVNSSIVWDNSPDEVVDTTNELNITYSNIKGGYPGSGNIDADPVFTDTANNNYHLSWINYPNDDYTKSPCINTGDPALPLDPDGSITDMGAYPFDESAQQQVTLDIRAFLEGCYFVNQMTPFLNSLGHLPLDQPYGIEPWKHYGTESVGSIPNSSVIDWVFVEMRKLLDYSSLDNYTVESRQAALLMNDGSIVGIDGSSSLEFYTAEYDSLHICLFHRNHLPIISANVITLTNNPVNYDFTESENMAIGGKYSQNELSTGVWGMIAGDGNADGQVDNNDKNDVWLIDNEYTGYYNGDFNMDSEVDVDDKIVMWELNSGKQSQIPE